MKKLLLLLLTLLMLTSCSKESTSNGKKSESENVPNNAEAEKALSLFEEGKLLPALETALSVYTHPDAHRIIADVSGAYSNGSKVLTKEITLPSKIASLCLSADGNFLAASDTDTTYLIDYTEARIIKTLPKGNFHFENDLLFVENEAFNMSGDIVEAKSANTVSEYRVENGKVTNGVWISNIEVTDGYLNIFPLTHEMYDENGEVVPYHSIVVANGSRLSAVDKETGKTVFDTTLSSEILMCKAGDGTVIIATKDFLSTAAELFSNKAKSPLFPLEDTLRLGDSYKFADPRAATDYSNGKIATAAQNSNVIELLYKVSLDIHQKLDINEPYPTAIASKGNVLALGTYEYLERERKNYLVEYNISTKAVTKREVSHAIDKIVYNNGWIAIGDGEVTAFDNAAEEIPKDNSPTVGEEFAHGDKNVTLNLDGSITDSLGNSIYIGFELCDMSEIAYADPDTLFITEYKYSGKSVLVSLSDMKVKAMVEDGIYFMRDANAILYKKGSEYGMYKYMNLEELKTFGENFLKNN